MNKVNIYSPFEGFQLQNSVEYGIPLKFFSRIISKPLAVL
ncbi:hypothetical protein BH10ACI1_BH10ACI1_20070 [soil metagenome]